MQREFRGVADPDQAWILGELIRYLEHPKSGALSFDDMGANWVPVRESVATGTLRANDKAAAEVASRFDALIRFSCLQLGRQLGAEVTPVLSRQELADPGSRNAALVGSLVANGTLSAAIRIPNAIAPLEVTADLRANRITCHFDVDAPREGKPTTRVNWLLRQLKEAPDSTRVEAFTVRSRAGAAELLRDVRDAPTKLVQDPTKEIRSFRIAQIHQLGTKRGLGRGSFIDSMLGAIDTTYGEVGQKLKAWSAAPPRLRSSAEVEVEANIDSDLPSNALSSQDSELPDIRLEA
jgi:hypothetical protein